jgi:HSP20 family molecular chaperone IbpA
MNRRDKIDLFLKGVEGYEWTQEKIDEFIESVDTELHADESNLTGIRREEVNGETREWYKVDGEWKEITDSGDYTLTLDMSGYLPLRDFSTTASLNNGVLEITFES